METRVLASTAIAVLVSVLFSPRLASAQGCVTMAMGSCRVRLHYRNNPSNADKFVVKCDGVSLGAGSNGIEPTTEGLTFLLSNLSGPCFSDTIAPGSIVRRGVNGGFYYNSPTKDGPGLRLFRLKGSRSAVGQFRMRAKATAADIQCLSGPPRVGLTIGGDCGTIACTERRPALYDCP